MQDDFSPIAEPVDDTASFVLWAIRQLGLEVTRHGDVCRLIVPEGASADRAGWAASDGLHIRPAGRSGRSDPQVSRTKACSW